MDAAHSVEKTLLYLIHRLVRHQSDVQNCIVWLPLYDPNPGGQLQPN